jgi:hypothetical protein
MKDEKKPLPENKEEALAGTTEARPVELVESDLGVFGRCQGSCGLLVATMCEGESALWHPFAKAARHTFLIGELICSRPQQDCRSKVVAIGSAVIGQFEGDLLRVQAIADGTETAKFLS